MESATLELVSALASLYETGKYSDLTIACGGKRYPVHRALLASRSTFFEGVCRNPFRESETGVVDLSEDEPEAVEHMVHYFYNLDYLQTPISRRSSQRSTGATPPLSPRLPTRRKSKKLNLSMLDDPLLAMASAANTATPLTPPEEREDPPESLNRSGKLPDTPMVEQFNEDPFDSLPPQQSDPSTEKAHLITHAKVYAIAEKYGVHGLKSLARHKFTHQIGLHFSDPELPEACQEVYETTVDTDRGLRDVVVQTFRSHPELSLREDVELAIRDTPGLAFELFRMASGLPVTSLEPTRAR